MIWAILSYSAPECSWRNYANLPRFLRKRSGTALQYRFQRWTIWHETLLAAAQQHAGKALACQHRSQAGGENRQLALGAGGNALHQGAENPLRDSKDQSSCQSQ